MKTMANLTEILLKEHAINASSKRQNFAVAPIKLPIEEIISNLEAGLKDVPSNVTDIY